jgi:predicted amidohydrolase
MRVASSQYRVRMLASYNEFEDHVRWHVESAAAQGARLLLLPEFFTAELLTLRQLQVKSLDDFHGIFEQFAKEYTENIQQLCLKLSAEYGIIIAAGSHFTHNKSDDKFYNTAFLFTPKGQIFSQSKIHPSYEMVYNKSMTTPGDKLEVFKYDGVTYGISICYDGSFPEVSRILTKLGADVILAPTACLDEWGRARNVMFAQARASENQVFVLNSHLIGSIPFPPNIPYSFAFTGQSGIYSPIQPMIGTPNGIIQQGEPNIESVVVGDLNLEYLRYVRENGHNRNRSDMRPEFYQQYV